MFNSLLNLLRCPVTQSELTLTVISSRKKSFEGSEQEIIWEGVLYGKDNWFYPVIDGIPRLVVEAFTDYQPFLSKHIGDYNQRKEYLEANYRPLIDDVVKKNKRTRESFAQEWSLYNYETDKTWDLDPKRILQRFLDETDETLASIKGKLIFDAGCGNGLLNILLAESGAPNVAMDFSLSIVRAFNRNKNPNVWFIQGDIEYPPVAEGQFDIVQCSGVLVHTRNPEKAFGCIAPCVKKNGKLSVWLYAPRKDFIHNLFNTVRGVTSRPPLKVQYYLYWATLFPVSFIIKRLKGNKQNAREMMIDILDWFSPQYRWETTPSKAANWFTSRNYKDVKVTTTGTFGYNIIGTKDQEP